MAYVNPIQSDIYTVGNAIKAEDFFGVFWPQEWDGPLSRHTRRVGYHRLYGKIGNAEQTFRAVAASRFAARIGVPVAPVLTHAPSSEYGDAFLYYSLGCFDTRVSMEGATGKNDRRKLGREDFLDWQATAALLTLPPREIEARLLKATSAHISALVPFYSWIGETDAGTYNTILDAEALLQTLFDPAQGNIGLYGVGAHVRPGLFKGPVESFSDYYRSSFTPADLCARIENMPEIPIAERDAGIDMIAASGGFDDITGKRTDNGEVRLIVATIPDWDVTNEIAQRIESLGNETIRQECNYIRDTLSADRLADGTRNELYQAAEETAETLIAQRGLMPRYANANVNFKNARQNLEKPGDIKPGYPFGNIEDQFRKKLSQRPDLPNLKAAFPALKP